MQRQKQLARRLVVAMQDPSFYPHTPERVELRETHISWVFIAGERVYKVKKPVVLPFLDYGPLERRREMCLEEVRLNRRLAARTYLGVRPVRATDSELRLDAGNAEIVEWTVEMRRLPEERSADQLLREGQLEPVLVRRLGKRLAEFHRDAATVPCSDSGPAAVAKMVQGNLRELGPLAGTVVDSSRLQAATRFAEA
jgi:uncharacterized protein